MDSVFLVFGATGRTGQHFVPFALAKGHTVRAVVREPRKLSVQCAKLEVHQSSITEELALDALLRGVNCVVSMLGDAAQQRESKINTHFVKKLIPAMRRQGVKRFLYQAGGFTRPYKQRLPMVSWLLRNTLARTSGLIGQHEDNEGVIQYLVEEAQDIEWMVHRASIFSDGPTKGNLKRSRTRLSVATFRDTAAYNYHLLMDDTAVHTYDLSYYARMP